jgi:branched-chain amino acid aminotransferase
MLEPISEYFVKDGYVLHTWEYDPSWNKRRKTIYEVLRVIDGMPLFEPEHTSRLMQSALSSGLEDIQPEKLTNSMHRLIDANNGEDGNILCCIISGKEGHHILSWYVEHRYPTTEQYENGVILRTLKAIRKNPATKVWNAELRSKAAYLINSSTAYEVLLIDKKKNVTEGSRSNIFFIRGNSVYTPPENKVLKGITRQKVLQLCQDLGIQLHEKEIPLHEMPFYEAAFITGTSPGVLAVNAIEDHRFNTSNAVIKKLMAAYNSLLSMTAIST